MYVVVNAKDSRESYAAKGLSEALDAACFDTGTLVHVYETECQDPSLARLGLGKKTTYLATIVVKPQ